MQAAGARMVAAAVLAVLACALLLALAPARAAAALTVEAAAAPAAVAAGEDVLITVVVRNGGPGRVRDVRLVQALPPGLQALSARAAQGTCRLGAPVVCRLGAMEAGAALQVLVAARASGEGILTTTSTVSGAVAGLRPPGPVATTSVAVGVAAAAAPVDLGVRVTQFPAQPRTGRRVGWLVEVTNWSATAAEGVLVRATVPPTVPTPALPSGCVRRAALVTCAVGTLASGATVRLALFGIARQPGYVVASATVTSAATDPDAADNLARVVTRIRRARAALAVDLAGSVAEARAGQPVSFLLKVRVLGSTAAQDVRVCARLPGPMAFERAPGAAFTRGRACWTVDELPPGGVRRFRVLGRVDPTAPPGQAVAAATAAAANAQTVRATAALVLRTTPARARPVPPVTG